MKRLILTIATALAPLFAGAGIDNLSNTLKVTDEAAWNSCSARLDSIRQKRPTVALVLSGGGAKGCAHIGVIQYLEEIGMPIDMVLGTSMGGLMGGLMSLGYNGDQIEKIVKDADWDEIMSDKILRKYVSYQEHKYKETYALSIPFSISKGHFLRSMPSAYVSGQNVSNTISSLAVGYQDSLSFDRLPIPFACVATDLLEGKGLVWMSGSIVDAMRCTMSIPLVFAPIRQHGRLLVDGGMRDNFPCDIARELGADIIIGVTVANDHLNYETAHNAADIIALAIDLSGKALLEETLKMPDVLLHPPLDGISALNFSDENVRKLIENGYREACGKSVALARLRKIVGVDSLHLNAKPAVNLQDTPILIDSVKYTGLKKMEERILRRRSKIEPGTTIDKVGLDKAVSKMYGYNSFEYVKYEISGKGPGYDILFDCKKGPAHQFGLGVRFDSEEMASAIVNVGLNAHKLYGARAGLTAKISPNPYARLDLSLDVPALPSLGLSADVRYTDTGLVSYGNSPLDISYLSSTQDFGFSSIKTKYWDLSLGIRNKVNLITAYKQDKTINYHADSPAFTDDYPKDLEDYAGAFFTARIDNTDNSYFPSKGFVTDLRVTAMMKMDKNLTLSDSFKDYSYATAYADIKTVIPFGKAVAFIPSLTARAILSANKGNVPILERNVIGGCMPGRYFEQQIDFIGITNACSVDEVVGVARADLRFKLGKNTYLTAKGQYYTASNVLFTGFSTNSISKETLTNILHGNSTFAAALELGFDTLLGPIGLNVHWCDARKENSFKGLGVYFSAGFAF